MKPLITILLLTAVWLHAVDIYATFDVEAERESELTLTSTGVIKTLYVDIGDVVQKGQLLLTLENDDLKLSMDLAKADLELAEINHRFAKQTYERYGKVKDVIDDDLFEQHQLNYEKSVAALTSSKANLAYRKAIYEKSLLHAPYDGVISKRHKNLGDGISGGMIEPIFTMISNSEVKLVLSFDEKYWQQVKPGAKVLYRVDGSDQNYEGTISKIYPTVNPKTRKMSAELYAKDLMPGLFGEATIKAE
jgi:RND family efflux transporter MFP subunit